MAGGAVPRRLDFADDRPFLEPLLFRHVTCPGGGATLDQLLLGSLAPSSRPASVEVRTDARGVVYLPGIGHFTTTAPGATLTLVNGPGEPFLEAGDTRLPASFEPVRRLAGLDLEVDLHPDASLAALHEGGPPEIVGRRHVSSLEQAVEILLDVAPEVFSLLASVLRRVVVFHAPGARSFASPAAHGAVFLQAAEDASAVFFLEDLAHQGGHVAFSAASIDPREYFDVDPDTPLVEGPDDARTRYVALHGVFTEALMVRSLFGCLEADVFEGPRRHEVIGRLSFAMKRMQLDLQQLLAAGGLSALGAGLLRRSARTFDDVFAKTRDLITKIDLSNQPYVFSVERFQRRNPAPERVRWDLARR